MVMNYPTVFLTQVLNNLIITFTYKVRGYYTYFYFKATVVFPCFQKALFRIFFGRALFVSKVTEFICLIDTNHTISSLLMPSPFICLPWWLLAYFECAGWGEEGGREPEPVGWCGPQDRNKTIHPTFGTGDKTVSNYR